jgi:hypothetical protein
MCFFARFTRLRCPPSVGETDDESGIGDIFAEEANGDSRFESPNSIECHASTLVLLLCRLSSSCSPFTIAD